MTLQWPMAAGPLPFNLAEPLVVLFHIVYVIVALPQPGLLTRSRCGAWVGVLAIVVWAFAVWLVAANWQARQVDLLGWVAPLVLFDVLLHMRFRSWGHIARLLMLAATPTLIAVFVERALNVGGSFYTPIEAKSPGGWILEAGAQPHEEPAVCAGPEKTGVPSGWCRTLPQDEVACARGEASAAGTNPSEQRAGCHDSIEPILWSAGTLRTNIQPPI